MSATATCSDVHATDRRALLLRSIRLDAAMSGSAGGALAAGGPWLDGALGAPAAFLVPLGIFLAVYAAALVALARGGAPSPAVKAVIAGNTLWAAASVVVVVEDWLTLMSFGTAFTLVQAAAVALLAELQLVALRRAGRTE
jgi:hypothetical protein